MTEPEGEYLKGFWVSDPDQKLDRKFAPTAFLFVWGRLASAA